MIHIFVSKILNCLIKKQQQDDINRPQYAQKKPGNIRVDDAALLYTLEAAQRSGLLEEKPRVIGGRGPSRPPPLQTHLSPKQLLNFGDSSAMTLAESLETRMKRGQLNIVDKFNTRFFTALNTKT